MNHLQRQRRSRKKLSEAVEAYINLRAADGTYEDTVRTTDRLGRSVVVFVKLEIISDEG